MCWQVVGEDIGPMRIAHFMSKDRGFENGGASCSTGRWSHDQRTLPDGPDRELLVQASRPPREVWSANVGGQGRALDFDVEVSNGQDHKLAV